MFGVVSLSFQHICLFAAIRPVLFSSRDFFSAILNIDLFRCQLLVLHSCSPELWRRLHENNDLLVPQSSLALSIPSDENGVRATRANVRHQVPALSRRPPGHLRARVRTRRVERQSGFHSRPVLRLPAPGQRIGDRGGYFLLDLPLDGGRELERGCDGDCSDEQKGQFGAGHEDRGGGFGGGRDREALE